jgi:hypothetical protein
MMNEYIVCVRCALTFQHATIGTLLPIFPINYLSTAWTIHRELSTVYLLQ